MSREGELTHCFDVLKGMIEDPVVMEILKRLEDFRRECEAIGIYDERKSLVQMRCELLQAKAQASKEEYIQ